VKPIIKSVLNNFSKLENVLIATILSVITQNPESFSEALQLAQNLRKKQGPLNIDVYNVLLDAACKNQNSTQIQTVLNLITSENIAPDQWTASTLLKVNIPSIEEKTKKLIHQIITRVLQEYPATSLSLEFITSLITYFYERRTFNKLERIYQMVKQNSNKYKFDRHFFDCVFRACSFSGNVKLGIEAFNDMVNYEIMMDRNTYCLLMDVFLRNKDKLQGAELKEAIACAYRVYEKAREFHEDTTADKEFQKFANSK
jgi:hypothetical protein